MAALTARLGEDMTARFGRSFSLQNIYNMRLFYLSYQPDWILQTLSGNWLHPPDDRFARRRLANSLLHPSRWV